MIMIINIIPYYCCYCYYKLTEVAWESPQHINIRQKYCGINIEHFHIPCTGMAARLMTDDNTHKNAWGRLSKGKPSGALEMTDALVTAPTLTALPCFWHTWAQVIFPPGSTREAMAAASVIACVTTLFLFLSINILRSAKLLSKSCINGKTKSIYYETCHPTFRWVLLHT